MHQMLATRVAMRDQVKTGGESAGDQRAAGGAEDIGACALRQPFDGRFVTGHESGVRAGRLAERTQGHQAPAVLHRYARQQNADPEWLNFCTGEMIEIDAITEQFGMFFARDGEGFSHNVRTVVVGPDGRIRRLFVGNEWTTEEFGTAMVEAARGR